MGAYPNYRVAVEAILKKDNKVLLMKRADDCEVAPGVWSVPAGKVKYEEIPIDGVIRECKEETGFDVKVIKEVDCRAFKTVISGQEAFRLVYSYHVELLDETKDELKISKEHSDYEWITKSDINNPKYNSLIQELKDIIVNKILV